MSILRRAKNALALRKFNRQTPSWVTWEPEKGEYHIDFNVALPLFFKAMGLHISDMSPNNFHTARRGIVNYFGKKRIVPGGVIRFSHTEDWIDSAKGTATNAASEYRKYTKSFEELLRGQD